MREANRLRAAGFGSSVLVVGELNPYGGPESNALVCWPTGCAGHRLQSRIFGLPEELYLSLHRRNLCSGDWSIQAARERAWSCLTATETLPWSTIVMLGRKVESAFSRYQLGFSTTSDAKPMEPFTARMAQGKTLIALPHPSGRNAASWGDAAIHRARKLLTEHVPEVPWGSLR